MTLNEVRRYLKKDPAATFTTILYRRAGVYITWLLLNVFPRITPNAVTISMLPIDLLSSVLLYYSVVHDDFILLVFSFATSLLVEILDCADGNIARIKNVTSIKGVFLDRLVHNIAHPFFYFALGFALFASTEALPYLALLMTAGILTELSPLDVAQQDTEILFIRQLVFGNSKNYDVLTHTKSTNKANKKTEQNNSKISLLVKIIKTFFTGGIIYLVIGIDFIFFPNFFFATILYIIFYMIAKIYSCMGIGKWEKNLGEALIALSERAKS